MRDICQGCGQQFKRLGTHWARSDCPRPEFSAHQWDTLVGILLGDGDIHCRNERNPLFRVRMINREFLLYLDDLFGPLSTGVFLERSAEYQFRQAKNSGHIDFENATRENYHDLYGWRTRCHPSLHDLSDWYATGNKRFPDDLRLNPTIGKMWYVCDGWLAKSTGHSPRVMIKAVSTASRKEELIGAFEYVGFSPRYSRDELQFTVDDTIELLDWFGDPPPGFEYKWETP